MTTPAPRDPFGVASVSYKPYVCDGTAAERLADFERQVALCELHGFDGVVVSEHHLGFPGYLPNPLQAVTWALASTRRLWAAPCPLLVLLRPTALVVEELAWLSCRHPGRVGAGFAAGSIAADFALADTDTRDLTARYERALAQAAAALGGRELGPLSRDPAATELGANPVPVVSAVSSSVAARRAARVGCGMVLESHTNPAYLRRFVSVYRDAGGDGPCVLNRRVWIGEAPRELQHEQVALYERTVPDYDRRAWLPAAEMVLSGTAESIAARLHELLGFTGATALTLRVHVAGLSTRAVHDQLARVATELLPTLRASAH